MFQDTEILKTIKAEVVAATTTPTKTVISQETIGSMTIQPVGKSTPNLETILLRNAGTSITETASRGRITAAASGTDGARVIEDLIQRDPPWTAAIGKDKVG